MSDEHLARQTASSFDRLENFNFLLSRHDPNLAKSRHYSFDADSAGLAAFSNLNMDYDQTEGMGGLSVSSYDSIEDERSPIDVRGYPYHDQMLSYSAHPIYPPISYGPPDDLGHGPGAMTPSDVSSSISPPNGHINHSKYSTQIPGDHLASALGQEEGVRRAAEEDRRRRNTAASARFRMKKKQREQTLERTVRETTEKNATLEARVAQLEMENRWLKNLLTEKHETGSGRMAPPPNDSTALTGNNATGPGQKHIQPKKKGVGTDN
ncbi:bZIP transcription factor [Aspergillus ellipticus CBS 707.79]|uniref:BZIP transcription factor n=1 Tax=Aspergillus ellipticus CBS 707.79 TaxID=1448320 RepID=A0A319DKX4_9EURO|nr:bZIP transcription factor [Aspergillus ellipticus CBS 707.79]